MMAENKLIWKEIVVIWRYTSTDKYKYSETTQTDHLQMSFPLLLVNLLHVDVFLWKVVSSVRFHCRNDLLPNRAAAESQYCSCSCGFVVVSPLIICIDYHY